MRLKSIKLAGFKSFVDPTTVHFPTNMSAVVGPNGCGKSNIIDAVRWVMGESSAKYLRGESMTDVIFNGSNARKPVGQASIELIFDNSDKTLTGEYAAFGEIAIRRRVSRDGDSSYYLNGTKCRRRDITDIFLGTGLGPRSYAIIEQGMISKLIEAKPEELRVYIEEAAGISRYKERRRDTENRIRRTRENLERLTDIRDELERQLQHLDRQAKTAERYKQLKLDERQHTALLQAIQWQLLQCQKTDIERQISALQISLESAIADKLKAESVIEKQRLNLTEQNDTFNAIQSQFYGLGADIARNEQRISTIHERDIQLKNDLQQSRASLIEISEHLRTDTANVDAAQVELDIIEPQLAIQQESEETASFGLEQAQAAMQEWQQQWDEFNAESAEAKQIAEVEQSRLQYVEQALRRLSDQAAALKTEKQTLSANTEEDLSELEAELEELTLRLEQLQSQQLQLTDTIANNRRAGAELNTETSEINSRLQQNKGRLSALEALQHSATTQGEGAEAWLVQADLQQARRLVDLIKVTPGWERALETVLGQLLNAVAVDDLSALLAADFSDAAGLSLIETPPLASAASGDLAQKVTGFNIEALLAGIYCADSVDAALTRRTQLQAHESVITPDGIWFGRNWLKLHRNADTGDSIFQRQAEIESLGLAAAEAELKLRALEQRKIELADTLQLDEQAERDCRRAVGELNQALTRSAAKLSGARARQHEWVVRIDKVDQDLAQNETQQLVERETMSEHRLRLEQALEDMAAQQDKREQMLARRDARRDALELARDTARQHKDTLMRISIRHQSLLTQIESVQQSHHRMEQQRVMLQSRVDTLELQFGENNEPLEDLRFELELKLQQRLEVEQQLSAARDQMQVIEADIRERELVRNKAEAIASEVRASLEQARITLESLRVQLRTINLQLQEADRTAEDLLSAFGETDLNEIALRQELERIQASISRLGAINLAAIDEYQQQSERKHYLDAQNQDLTSALETLENAIRKIDRETRSRFKETFDEVNAGLSDLFPQVFGGGQAYLELTGDDLLDTGIAIMARPPGKKNSTIHLLSGGEKALTAIALVFAIFRLNPAPFCMLDEVDAPLDDANVGRYAKLVKTMSTQVQFIYITHNKIPMEYADQLMGVTMHEPGVSRLVTVDIEKAAELAAV